MSDELTLDVAVENIERLVRENDKLNTNWKNELSRRIDTQADVVRLAAERDDLTEKVRTAIERLTPTADELDSMACAGTPDVYLEQWLRECLNATRTRADSAEGALAHVMAENTAKTELLTRIRQWDVVNQPPGGGDGAYWAAEIDALFAKLAEQEWGSDAAPDA